MSAALDIEAGHEFAPQTFTVEAAEQAGKLVCCGIDPALYGEDVDVGMLGLPTLRVLMAAGVPILGGVHLTQRFRQLAPFRLGEPITVSARLLDVLPHPRGCILKCAVDYARADGEVLVEAVRSGITPMGEGKPAGPMGRPDEDLEGFAPDMERTLEPQKVADYSDEAGNLIHSDPEVARRHGFRAPIAAGLMGIHFYREALERYHAPRAFDLEVWFRRPMFWDDTLSLFVRRDDGDRIARMHLVGSSGKPTSNCVIHAVEPGG